MIRKHSTTLHGHRTSFSLEDEFWAELTAIATTRAIPLAALISEIDDNRQADSNLSSALRLHVLAWLKSADTRSPAERPALRPGRQRPVAMPQRVEIVVYDAAWPARFRQIADRCSTLLGHRVLAIRHVGSTAIPGLFGQAADRHRRSHAHPRRMSSTPARPWRRQVMSRAATATTMTSSPS
jgi:predicted DNA-binding ribbon-helix-helix protein